MASEMKTFVAFTHTPTGEKHLCELFPDNKVRFSDWYFWAGNLNPPPAYTDFTCDVKCAIFSDGFTAHFWGYDAC